jgi:hypothetical protein
MASNRRRCRCRFRDFAVLELYVEPDCPGQSSDRPEEHLMTEPSGEFNDETRDRLLGEVSGFFTTIGFAMAQRSYKLGDQAASATAICVQTNGDLSESYRDLIHARHYYPATVLGRQLLEVTQLIEYFMIKPERARFWLTASDEDLKKAGDFRPAKLRAATSASDWVYDRHCFLGGHPRSIARMLLPGSPWRRPNDVIDLSSVGLNIRTGIQGLLLADCLQHSYDAVLATIQSLEMEAFDELGPLKEQSVELTDNLIQRLVAWRATDPLATLGKASEEG